MSEFSGDWSRDCTIYYFLLKGGQADVAYSQHTTRYSNLAKPGEDREGEWLDTKRANMEVEAEHRLLVELHLGVTATRNSPREGNDEVCINPAIGWLINKAVNANQTVLRFQRVVTAQ